MLTKEANRQNSMHHTTITKHIIVNDNHPLRIRLRLRQSLCLRKLRYVSSWGFDSWCNDGNLHDIDSQRIQHCNCCNEWRHWSCAARTWGAAARWIVGRSFLWSTNFTASRCVLYLFRWWLGCALCKWRSEKTNVAIRVVLTGGFDAPSSVVVETTAEEFVNRRHAVLPASFDVLWQQVLTSQKPAASGIYCFINKGKRGI